jgi:hypothetical protein
MTEDLLLDFVLGLGNSYFEFLGCLRSEYLSVSGIGRLLSSISLNVIDESLWSSLSRRLALSVECSPVSQSRHAAQQFPFESSRPLNGILASLNRECGCNAHTAGTIAITASSNGYNQCHQVVDYDSKSYWHSNDVPNSWIRFDFKDRRICVSNYTIRTDTCQHLMKWSFDGSNDGISWTTLDQRDTQELKGAYVVKFFTCAPREYSDSFFRFIRLIQTGPSSDNQHFLMFSKLELFGTVL